MRRRRSALLMIAAGAVVVMGLAGTFALGGYRINVTPSYPLGLWQIEPLMRDARVGDRIFICLPAGDTVILALERHYLPRGLCPSGSGPLIKTVAAVADQVIEIDGHVIIDGKPLAASRLLQADAQGRVMPAYAGGRITQGTVFLHSKFLGSYDSRYFGPVPTTGTLGLAREILTFAP